MPDARRAWAGALFLAPGGLSDRKARADALEVAGRAARSLAGERFFSDPSIAAASKSAALAGLLGDDGVWVRFCDLLIRKRRQSLLTHIAAEYSSRLDRELGIDRLEVETPRPLDETTLGLVREAWQKRSGASSVEIRQSGRPELLGGFRVRSGSLRWDLSVAGRLERLRGILSRPLERTAGESERMNG